MLSYLLFTSVLVLQKNVFGFIKLCFRYLTIPCYKLAVIILFSDHDILLNHMKYVVIASHGTRIKLVNVV